MFVNEKFRVILSDVNAKLEMTNTAFLRYFQEVGNMHSEIAGYGVSDIDRTNISWILISWKVNIIKRPKYGDEIRIKTWSLGMNKFFAFRDFEVKNQYDEVVAYGASKWSIVDVKNGKLISIPKEIDDKYTKEDTHVFDDDMNLSKLVMPKVEPLSKCDFKITRSLIDVNKHLNNVYYMDIAKEAISEEKAIINEFNDFEVMYKKEIKLGEVVKASYYVDKDYHYVVIKDCNEENLHSIVRFK